MSQTAQPTYDVVVSVDDPGGISYHRLFRTDDLEGAKDRARQVVAEATRAAFLLVPDEFEVAYVPCSRILRIFVQPRADWPD